MCPSPMKPGGMINAEAISQMKEDVVLLNFARDLLVDEKALVEALENGRVRKYVTDFCQSGGGRRQKYAW